MYCSILCFVKVFFVSDDFFLTIHIKDDSVYVKHNEHLDNLKTFSNSYSSPLNINGEFRSIPWLIVCTGKGRKGGPPERLKGDYS